MNGEIFICGKAWQPEIFEGFTETQVKKFGAYMEGVLQWNEKVNLTAITDPDEFLVKHIFDSVMCRTFPEFQGAKHIIDVGTGAGFPGVPLAIIAPDKSFILMDSLNKRLKIVSELCSKAEIFNVETVHARAEELAKDEKHREKYDLCVSRAVANMSVLAEYCLPFIKVGGSFIAYKGPDCEAEVESCRKAVSVLGGEISQIRSSKMEKHGLMHSFVIIKKVKSTPAKFPRKAGIPSKEPL